MELPRPQSLAPAGLSQGGFLALLCPADSTLLSLFRENLSLLPAQGSEPLQGSVDGSTWYIPVVSPRWSGIVPLSNVLR